MRSTKTQYYQGQDKVGTIAHLSKRLSILDNDNGVNHSLLQSTKARDKVTCIGQVSIDKSKGTKPFLSKGLVPKTLPKKSGQIKRHLGPANLPATSFYGSLGQESLQRHPYAYVTGTKKALL